MRDLFFYELRERVKQIRAIEETLTPSEISQKRQIIFDTYDTVCKLANIAHKEGLLSLEEYASSLPKKGSVVARVTRTLCFCICDGADPSNIEEIAFNRYMTETTDGYEGLAILICIRGLLMMQNYETRYWVKELIQSMIPFDLVEE